MDLLGGMLAYLRVVDAGNLTKAARALRVTPAAISRQLSALESELGATLVIRTTRSLAMTEEGRRFYEHARRTVAEAEEARASVRADHAISGRISVSVPTALGVSLLDLSIVDLVVKHPGLRVELRLEDHPVDLLGEGVDVAIRAGLSAPETNALVARLVTETARVIVGAPSYLKRRGEPVHALELTDHDALVHLHAGSGVGAWRLERDGEALSIEVRGPFSANSFLALRNAAIAGAGLAQLPHFLVAKDLEEGRLRVVPMGGWGAPPQKIFSIIRAEAKRQPKIRAFLDHAHRALVAASAT